MKNIKFLIVLLISCLFSMNISAQTPEKFNYQAVARDASGALLINQSVGLKLSLLSGSPTGTIVYSETHNVSTNAYGLFTVEVGGGTVSSGTFAAIDWGSGSKYLKIELDPAGGTVYVNMGAAQLLSVPYALYARDSEAPGPGGANTTVQFNDNGSLNGENMLVWDKANNRLGIGTATPDRTLTVNGFIGLDSWIYHNGDANTNILFSPDRQQYTVGNVVMLDLYETTQDYVKLGDGGDVDINLNDDLFIDGSSGEVGIGTITPDQKFQVHTTSGISYIRVSDNTTGITSGLRLGLSGAGNAYIINDEPLKSLSLGTDGTSQMRILSNGRVGINELTPDQVLHIKQDAANRGFRIEHQSATDYWENGIGTTTKNYKFYYNNVFRADISSTDGAYVSSSDRSLKKEIRVMDAVLDDVMKLVPSSYYYIDNQTGGFRSMGFIAQDVEPLFPDLVRDTDNGYKGLVYDGFAVIAIKAIQEQQETIKTQQMLIEELIKRVELLEKGK